MSREIKFRGQRVDNGEWVYGCLLLDKSRNDEYAVRIQPSEDGQYFAFTVIPETVGQYTGLKDKNGKEIYEGDIIQFKHEKLVEKEHEGWDLPYDFETNEYYRNYVVEFTNTNTHYGLRLRNKNIWFMIHKMTLLTHDAIVIGNTHDNPELLQEVDKQ